MANFNKEQIDYLFSCGYDLSTIMKMDANAVPHDQGTTQSLPIEQDTAPEAVPDTPQEVEKAEPQEVKKNSVSDFSKFETIMSNVTNKIEEIEKTIQRANRQSVDNSVPKEYTADDAIKEIFQSE